MRKAQCLNLNQDQYVQIIIYINTARSFTIRNGLPFEAELNRWKNTHKRLKLASSPEEHDCERRQYYTIPVWGREREKKAALSCLNRMIAAGLKGPSARRALEERVELSCVGGAKKHKTD